MKPLTPAEREWVQLRKEVRRRDQEEAARMASTQLWRDYSSESWCNEAAQARKAAQELSAAKEKARSQRWRDKMSAAVAESFVDLDIH